MMAILDLDSIHLIKDFPVDQYYPQSTDKNQIVLHHTVSGPGVFGDVNWWKQTPERIATHFIIARDGTIYQCFNSRYWAHHLGVKTSVFRKFNLRNTNRLLNAGSISIEYDSWGGVDNNTRYHGPVEHYPKGYRGYTKFERYTAEQIESSRQLLEYFGKKYDIPLSYNADMWDVSKRALQGTPGVWSHGSFRPDKSDCHPQPELVEMLQSFE